MIDYEYLVKAVNDGKSSRTIADELSCSKTNVSYWLKKYGLQTHAMNPRNKGKHKPLCCCKCGETNPDKFYGHKRSICGKCHNKDNKQRGFEMREKAVKFLGGKCVRCGYHEFTCSLDVHHKDPSKKDSRFKRMRYWSWTRLKKELEQCILLCKNCHAVVHSGLIDSDQYFDN